MGRRGFTLLELLISITIISFIVVLAGTVMKLGFQSINRGEKRIDYNEQLRTSFAVLDAQVQSAMPLKFTNSDNVRVCYFKGENKYLQLATNYSIWSGEKGYVTVNYRIETDNTGKESLHASESVIGIDATRETKLLDGLDEIFFEYYLKNIADKDEKNWVDEWSDTTILPEKIRFYAISRGKVFDMVIPVRVWQSSVKWAPLTKK